MLGLEQVPGTDNMVPNPSRSATGGVCGLWRTAALRLFPRLSDGNTNDLSDPPRAPCLAD